MKVIDARRNTAAPLLRRWRGRLRGAVTSTITSATPAVTWAAQLPILAADARRARRASLRLQLRRAGRDPDQAWLDLATAERERAVQMLQPDAERVVALLVVVGVQREKVLQLLDVVPLTLVAPAVVWLDVVEILALDDARGAA
jgi:hypothetical protein